MAAARAMREAGLRDQGGDDHARGRRTTSAARTGSCARQIDGKVIIRTGRRIPGVPPVAGVHYPIAVVRMAVEDAYGAEERRAARRTATRSRSGPSGSHRSVCRAVAEYAFATAERMHARVYGGPKWTVSPVYEGMLKEELDAAAAAPPGRPYQPQLIDVTLRGAGRRRRRRRAARDPGAEPRRRLASRSSCCACSARSPAPSRCCSSFDEDYRTRVVMTEAPHGTAPALEGKNIANPMAMILAVAALLRYVGERGGSRRRRTASRAIYEAVLEAIGVGRADAGPRRACDHVRVHRRGDRARAHQARDLVDARAAEPRAGCAIGTVARAGRRAGAARRRGEGTPIVLAHGLTATRRYVVHGSRLLERSG